MTFVTDWLQSDGLHRSLELLALVPVIFGSLVLHEVAHGRAALALGDETAKRQGRLSLNPLKHLDPLGLLLFVVCITTLHIGFGWAKPVPIDPRNLRDPKWDMAKIAIAGPAMNFALAAIFALLLWLLDLSGAASVGTFLDQVLVSEQIPLFRNAGAIGLFMLIIGVTSNLVLGLINLIPIPPLDGSRILYAMLPYRWGARYYQLQQFTIPGLIAIPVLLICYNLFLRIPRQ